MNELSTVECLAYGGIISVVVSAAKAIPLVKQYPKIVATVLSIAITLIATFIGDDQLAIKPFVICVLTQLAAAVGTHEVVVQPVKKQLDEKTG
jgi:hypothetical protein